MRKGLFVYYYAYHAMSILLLLLLVWFLSKWTDDWSTHDGYSLLELFGH